MTKPLEDNDKLAVENLIIKGDEIFINLKKRE
jgi:hypothetical protein